MPEKENQRLIVVYAHCPACGGPDLIAKPVPDPDNNPNGDYAVLYCWRENCPDPDAANKILGDNEIHHIVRFDSDSETFNVKHPLRERVNSELLDCSIHSVVVEAIDMDSVVPEGSWRLIGHPSVYIPGGPDQEADWEWEPL